MKNQGNAISDSLKMMNGNTPIGLPVIGCSPIMLSILVKSQKPWKALQIPAQSESSLLKRKSCSFIRINQFGTLTFAVDDKMHDIDLIGK